MNKEVSANSTARMMGKKPAAGALILPKGSFIDSMKAPKASMKNKMLVTRSSFCIDSLLFDLGYPGYLRPSFIFLSEELRRFIGAAIFHQHACFVDFGGDLFILYGLPKCLGQSAHDGRRGIGAHKEDEPRTCLDSRIALFECGRHVREFFGPFPSGHDQRFQGSGLQVSTSRSQANDASVDISSQDSRSNGSLPSQGNVDEIDAGLLLE